MIQWTVIHTQLFSHDWFSCMNHVINKWKKKQRRQCPFTTINEGCHESTSYACRLITFSLWENPRKKAALPLSKAVLLLRVSPNPEEAFGLTATTDTSATPVSDERELREEFNAQETSESSAGEKNQRCCELEGAGPFVECNMSLIPRQRYHSGTKRKSDEFGAKTKSTENEDYSIYASTSRALTSLLVSPLKKLTTEDVPRGTSRCERVFNGIEGAVVPTRNAALFMAADSASLTKTAEDVNREETIQTQGTGTSACTSVVPKVASTSTITSEQYKTTPRASPENSVAGILQWSPTEARRKVDTDEGDRQESGACGKYTTTSEATMQHSTASLAHSENAFTDPDEVYLPESILADRIAKDWNTSFYGRAEETTFVMTSDESSEMASSSSNREETDTADSGTPEDVPKKPLPLCEFQQAPTGDQSTSYHIDVSKLSPGQHSDYDGSFPSAYSAEAAPTCTNAVTDSLHNVPPQRIGVTDQEPNLTFVSQGKKAERVRALYPCQTSLLDERSERASSDQSACTSAYEKVPQNATVQPTTGGYQQPSGATGRGAAHRSVAQWILLNGNQHYSAAQDTPQNLRQRYTPVAKYYRNAPSFSDHLQTDAAQPLPALQLQLQNGGEVTKHTSSPGSDNSVPSVESVSPGQKAPWKLSKDAARLQRSTRLQGTSPLSDDSVASLESLSPGQKAAWKLTPEAACVKSAHQPQKSSPASYDSDSSLEFLSLGHKVAWKLSELAAQTEQSRRPQIISSSASKDQATGLEMPSLGMDARIRKNRRSSHPRFAFGSDMPREINSPDSYTTSSRLETITARGSQTRATNKGAGHQDCPGARRIQQVTSPLLRHPLTVLQNSNFTENQRASAAQSLHQGTVQQPNVLLFKDNSFLNKTLPPQDVFRRLNGAQEAPPRTTLHSISADASAMSDYPGKQVSHAKTHVAGNAKIDAVDFSQQQVLHLREMQKNATPRLSFPRLFNPPVEYASQYPVAAPSNALPASVYHSGVYSNREIRPVTAPVQSHMQRVRRRTPLDILVSVASNLPPADETRPHLTPRDLEQLNARLVERHSQANLSFFEASYRPSAHEQLAQLTNKNLGLLHGNTQVNAHLAEQSSEPPMPWQHNSFSERCQGSTTYTRPPSMLSLPTETNTSPVGFISSPNPHFLHRETQQSAQISLHGSSSTRVPQQGYEHKQPQVSYQHSSYVENSIENRSFSWEVTQPAVTMEPLPPAQTSQTSSSSNLVNDRSYPTPFSAYQNTQRCQDYTPSLGSVQQASSYMYSQTSLEQAFLRGSHEVTSTSASYEHMQSLLSYQNTDVLQDRTAAAGLPVAVTPHAQTAGMSSSSPLVYGPAYPPGYSTNGNSQLLTNYTPYVHTAEQGNLYTHQDRSLEEAISMASRQDTSTYAVPGMLPSNSQPFS